MIFDKHGSDVEVETHKEWILKNLEKPEDNIHVLVTATEVHSPDDDAEASCFLKFKVSFLGTNPIFAGQIIWDETGNYFPGITFYFHECSAQDHAARAVSRVIMSLHELAALSFENAKAKVGL